MIWENNNETYTLLGFPVASAGKDSACNLRDPGLIPGLGRFPEEGNSKPLQCSCLENPMDRGAWGATAHGVTESQTQLRDCTCIHTHQISSPLFVKVQDDPQALTSFGNFLNIILSWDFQNLSKLILQLGCFPLSQSLLPARQEEERDILPTCARTHPFHMANSVEVQVHLLMCQGYFKGRTL